MTNAIRHRLTRSAFVAVGLLSVAVPSFAQTKPAPAASSGAVGLPTPLGLSTVQKTVGNVIQALMGLIGTAALVMFIWGGFIWLTSQGDPKQVQKAKDTIVWAAIGIVAVLSAYSILRFVTGALTVSGL